MQFGISFSFFRLVSNANQTFNIIVVLYIHLGRITIQIELQKITNQCKFLMLDSHNGCAGFTLGDPRAEGSSKDDVIRGGRGSGKDDRGREGV